MAKETKGGAEAMVEEAKDLLAKVLAIFPDGSSIDVAIHADKLSLNAFAGTKLPVKIEPNVEGEISGIRGTSDFSDGNRVSGTVFFPITVKIDEPPF